MKNRYGLIHGGEIFKLLDEKCLEVMISEIGDGLTSNANINYLKPILSIDEIETKIEVINKTNNTLTLEGKIFDKKNKEILVSSSFTFIKCKNLNCKIN